MSRYIDADALKDKLQQHHDFYVMAWGGFGKMPIGEKKRVDEITNCIAEVVNAPTIEPKQGEWIPCSERLPSEKERKEWIDNNLDGIGYLYPCLVTRYSSINPDRTKNNPYVAKHYFDGEDFVNCGEEVCSEYILAWMPLPKPYKESE